MARFYRRVTVDGRCQLVHRLVAEKSIGRKLGEKEVVHHIDEDKLNNAPENLMVMRSSADHAALHKGSEPIFCQEKGHWYCHLFARNDCQCGSQISRGAVGDKCIACHKKHRRSRDPDPIELEDLLMSNSGNMKKSAIALGMSDNGLRRMLRRAGLDASARHWRAKWKDGRAAECARLQIS